MRFQHHYGHYSIGKCAAQKIEAVSQHRLGSEIILAHPRCGERHQRKPKQKMQIRPQKSARNFVNELKKVVVIDPVNPDKNEAQHIGQECRQKPHQLL